MCLVSSSVQLCVSVASITCPFRHSNSAQLPAFVAVQISGHLIPKGTWVHINIYGEAELAVQAMASCLACPCKTPVQAQLAVLCAFSNMYWAA